MPEKKACPLCAGTGGLQIKLDIKMYPATVNTYESIMVKGTRKHRVRLEIPRAFHDDFLSVFGKGDKVAIFVIPAEGAKSTLSEKELEEYVDG